MKRILLIVSIILLTGCSSNIEPSGKVVDLTKSDSSDVQQIEESVESNEIEKITLQKNETKTIKTTYGETDYEFEINYINSFSTDEVNPPDPKERFYSYYKDTSGEKYIIYEFKVKNLSSETLSDYIFENFLGDDCKPKFIADGKYEYSGFFVMVEGDNSSGHDLTTLVYIEPLSTKTIYYVISVPDEVKSMSWDCNICAGEKEVIFQ